MPFSTCCKELEYSMGESFLQSIKDKIKGW